jgi:hypothetical protein
MPKLLFGFEQYKVENCRSRGDHNDSDWLSVNITAGLTLFPEMTVQLGDNLHAGDEVRDVFVGPVDVPNDQLVSVTYTVNNWSHSEDQSGAAKEAALKIGGAVLTVLGGVEGGLAAFNEVNIAEAEAAIIGAIGGVLETIGEIVGIHSSDPDCDGQVLFRWLPFLPGTLGPTKIGPTVETVRSPSKCGNDPHTTVIYSIRGPFEDSFKKVIGKLPI